LNASITVNSKQTNKLLFAISIPVAPNPAELGNWDAWRVNF
jgi:hypothetical protein